MTEVAKSAISEDVTRYSNLSLLENVPPNSAIKV